VNYKKLFWGYVTFNFICGIILGGYRAIQQGKVNERLNTRKFSNEMQKMVNHYTNKEKVA
jgi:hypothetical protein